MAIGVQQAHPLFTNSFPVGKESTPPPQLRNAAEQGSVVAKEIERKIANFESFISDATNRKYIDSFLADQLKSHIGDKLFNYICSIFNTQEDNGQELIRKNFNIILQLQDSNGNNPLQKVLNHFKEELKIYQAIIEINTLAIELHGSAHAFFPETREVHKNDAIAHFRRMSPKAKELLNQQIQALDGNVPAITYGDETTIRNVHRLYDPLNTCPVSESLKKLEEGKIAPFNFSTSHTSTEKVRSGDSNKTAHYVQMLTHLENLKALLSNPNHTSGFLKSKYVALPKDIKAFLGRIAWVACYQPEKFGFGDHLLESDLRWLIKTQDGTGLTLLDQLISHCKAKVEFSRLKRELNGFLSQPRQTSQAILSNFNQLSDFAKGKLREEIWRQDGKKSGHFSPDFSYGTKRIEGNPFCLFEGTPSLISSYCTKLKSALNNADAELFKDLEQAVLLPKDPIDASTEPLEKEPGLIRNLPSNVRIVHVSAELKSPDGTASVGGLGVALQGIIKGLGSRRCRVILPLYHDVVNDPLVRRMKETDYEVYVEGRKVKVFKAKVKISDTSDDTVSCYFIDAPHIFRIPKVNGKVGDIYGGDMANRFWFFSSAAAHLCELFYRKTKPIKIVHAHDAQTALIADMLRERNPEKWGKGETPTVFFTFHNNNEQVVNRGKNAFIEGLRRADGVSTVSKTFAKEAQHAGDGLGKGIGDEVKKAAREKKFWGIVNGSSVGFNPEIRPQLKNWSRGIRGGPVIDLSYSAKMGDRPLVEKLKLIQKELCDFLRDPKRNDPSDRCFGAYADLDPEKPIFMYVGRFDLSQKGINQLFELMKRIVEKGGQFICTGTDPNNAEARDCIQKMKDYARKQNCKGVLILEDERLADGSLRYQGVFGDLCRGASRAGIGPSFFEPCGLIQGEFFCFGKKFIATKTGGFADTVNQTNGYLFERAPNCDHLEGWLNSREQTEKAVGAAEEALTWAKKMQHALHHGTDEEISPYMAEMKEIMRSGLASTWETTPDGSLSPIRLLELAYAKAFQGKSRRGGTSVRKLKTLAFEK